ncbi:sigma-54 dependent transcriptional regulator [Mucilaginibacter sp. BJC16-A38]|uniref:sigma-54-dependent transcriptional regulator n=1 Tax=Mucilaginibacter phenanthrenivorans TaxID=1234842 RepID=UPI0021573FC5|nr:sigma-54 dependent transcriptional regulator [Mucilaginibacter phenanthrenivorans]MCR8558811.1 sigma-54 dependent transcriptional regulator [Mucilaginibacter phenanthrenivorans]
MLSTILIVEDENKFGGLLSRIIEAEGYNVLQAQSARSGLKFLENEDIRVVISDVKLPDANGVELVKRIKDMYPHVEVINLTAFGSIKDSVKAMKNGAFDYIMKGDDNDRIIPIVNKAVEKANLQLQVSQLEKKLKHHHTFDTILGKSTAITEAITFARKVAPTNTTALLLGETGTGKEIFAQAIHEESDRRNKPLIAVNCSSFSDELLKSELFGHLAGSFTGATKDKKGLFEEADGGTLFLDEIGEMNLDLQARLLRVLEDGTFNRVGDSKSTKVNVRIIAATNKDLKHEAENNRFRLDLFYRLAVFTIHLPPLADRTEDIEILGNHFLKDFSNKLNRKIKKMDDAFLKALNQHSWKGNIRELKNVIERSVIIANGDTLTPDLLHFDFFSDSLENQGSTLNLATIESQYIRKAMSQSKGNKTEASKLLGIGLSTLYRKIEDYNL